MVFEVYQEVADVGQPRLTGRWVCTQKIVDGKLVPKARYVIRGFQENITIPADSPTASKECMRLVLSIIDTKFY